MPLYRCLFTSASRVQVIRAYESSSDAVMILRAKGFMSAQPEHSMVEIWERKRFVARLARNPLAQGGLDVTEQ